MIAPRWPLREERDLHIILWSNANGDCLGTRLKRKTSLWRVDFCGGTNLWSWAATIWMPCKMRSEPIPKTRSWTTNLPQLWRWIRKFSCWTRWMTYSSCSVPTTSSRYLLCNWWTPPSHANKSLPWTPIVFPVWLFIQLVSLWLLWRNYGRKIREPVLEILWDEASRLSRLVRGIWSNHPRSWNTPAWFWTFVVGSSWFNPITSATPLWRWTGTRP